MLNLLLVTLGVIFLTIAIVWLIDKFIPSKLKPLIMLALWGLIAFLGYTTFMDVYGEIKFNKLKNQRYAQVIERLVDIRDSQLAHKTVNGNFAKSFDDLIKFIDTAQYTITQRRDSTVIDKELTRRFGGVTMTKDIVIIDTLGYVPVKDSLFKNSDRYRKLMFIPTAKEGTKFTMNAGMLTDESGKIKTPVFEVIAKKKDILYDQDAGLITKESKVVSVEAVNGDAIKVGSMTEVKTNGNWPKTYGDNE